MMQFTMQTKREGVGRYSLWNGCIKLGDMHQGDRGWTVKVGDRDETHWRFNEARAAGRRLAGERLAASI